MSKLPSMPFFPADFFADTAHLTPEAQGAYLVLLGHAWLQGGSLPNDDAALIYLARVRGCRWARIKKQIIGFWQVGDDGRLRNKRLTKELEYVKSKYPFMFRDTDKTLKNNGWITAGQAGDAWKPRKPHKPLKYNNRGKGVAKMSELPRDRVKSLKFEISESLRDDHNHLKLKDRPSTTHTNPYKEFLNGEKRQRRENRVFVKTGTEQWNAWVIFYQKSQRKNPPVINHYETREEGMFFEAEWPPPISSDG